MKRFAKFFVVALVVTLVASMFAVVPSAAYIVDANKLTPASDRVVFIMDPDENGELPGDGSGTSAENPLEAMDHESFDPDADYPKYYLQTPFYQATELLKETGGTIVICGPTLFGPDQSYGQGSTTRDTYTAAFGDKTIKFTSVYNGVDYRETNGAKIIIETPAELGIKGQSIWENIDIETVSTNRVISFHNFATLVGEGVNCYPQDSTFEGVSSNYVSLSAGHRYDGGIDLVTNLVVKSGSYNAVVAGSWGVTNQRKLNDDGSINWSYNMEGSTVTNLVLEGTTTVYGEVVGTTRQNSEFSGSANITINGGKYECDINVVGPTGMLNTDGQAILKINGGDFSSCWSINDRTEGHLHNGPAFSLLDFSGWTGDISGIASAFGVTTSFTNYKFPDGVTQEEVIAAAGSLETTAPVVEQTDAPAADNEATSVPDNDDENADDKDETQASVGVEEENGGNGLIIGIVIAAVAVIAIVVVVALVAVNKMKKKMEQQAQNNK